MENRNVFLWCSLSMTVTKPQSQPKEASTSSVFWATGTSALPEGLWEQQPHWGYCKPDSNPAQDETEFKPRAQQKPLSPILLSKTPRKPVSLYLFTRAASCQPSMQSIQRLFNMLVTSTITKGVWKTNQGLGKWFSPSTCVQIPTTHVKSWVYTNAYLQPQYCGWGQHCWNWLAAGLDPGWERHCS